MLLSSSTQIIPKPNETRNQIDKRLSTIRMFDFQYCCVFNDFILQENYRLQSDHVIYVPDRERSSGILYGELTIMPAK